jgi:membrane protease YdiL (CAAX protease family)
MKPQAAGANLQESKAVGLLIVEFVVLFAALPTAFALANHRLPAIPTLWLVTCYCLLMLLSDTGFDRSRLWRAGAVSDNIGAILILWVAAVSVIGAAVCQLNPGLFLNFPRTNPRLWLLVMVLYPLVSVYPQGIIYRAFLMHRYERLFGSGVLMILVAAAAFAYLHVIFKNWIAVGMTFLGGLIFAYRYWQAQSLLVSSIEHALYGCLMFTVGLGEFFYHASRKIQPS